MDRLTARQMDVARLLACTGASNKELAAALGIAMPTLRNILTRVYRTLGLDHSPSSKRVALTRLVWAEGQEVAA